MWMVPEAANIPRTSQIGDKSSKLKSEDCDTKVVSVFFITSHIMFQEKLQIFFWFLHYTLIIYYYLFYLDI